MASHLPHKIHRMTFRHILWTSQWAKRDALRRISVICRFADFRWREVFILQTGLSLSRIL